MTCHHKHGDPTCSSSSEGIAREYARREKDLAARTPNPDKYEIVEVKQVGAFLVAMVQYTSCKNCSFDAKKVMVFPDTTIEDVIYWKHVDPHFRESSKVHPNLPKSARVHAPAPRARFPADEEGWADAIDWANKKKEST